MRTGEWLAEARRQADLSQVKLAKLIGLNSAMLISAFETGARVPDPQAWEKLESALRPLAPLMFIDEEKLLDYAKAGLQWEGEGALCRLAYFLGKHGFVFVGVSSVREDPPAGPYITVLFEEAVRLLGEQIAGFDPPVAPRNTEEGEGAQLRRMREALGLGQRDVAAMLSTHQATISHIERGEKRPGELMGRYRELMERMTAES